MDVKGTHRYYYIDEAGDGVLFSSRGKIIIGTQGCSCFYSLGILDVICPSTLTDDFRQLRINLLTDPYFKNVPSMQVKASKTALTFHAKDDLPEVRKQVFDLLLRHELRFFAVVRDKQKVIEYVKSRNLKDPAYRYNENELYDYIARRLFKDRLHQEQSYDIIFSKRGASDRTAALKAALDGAKHRFHEKWGIQSEAQINVACDKPQNHAGLQAADYFLWALQRAYERGESRFIELLWSKVSLVHDIDDTRTAAYGVYYTKKKPLTAAARKK